jgi:2-polyprenyl-3-methyl-5-hydroxy-6-metoxy-1,4-benzoquinol methylase
MTKKISQNNKKMPSQSEVRELLNYYKKGKYDNEENISKTLTVKYPYYQFGWKVLGSIFKHQGKLRDSLLANQRAVEILPNDAEAHSNLGVSYKDLNQLDNAESCYKKAISINPNYAEAHHNLAITLFKLGRLEEALGASSKSININSTNEAKNLLSQIIKRLVIKGWDQSLANLLSSALLEPWSRPSSLISIACRLLKTNSNLLIFFDSQFSNLNQFKFVEYLLDTISKNEFTGHNLIEAILTSSHITDYEVENFFQLIRNYLLRERSSNLSNSIKAHKNLNLFCSIAQQCFINEYVFYQSQEEINTSFYLRNTIEKALENNIIIQEIDIITIACYFPLHSILGSELLLLRDWSENVNKLITQQIIEPLEEVKLHKSIQTFEAIDNQVSIKVKDQYEINPYPRWVKLPNSTHRKSINSYIQSRFPLATFDRLVNDKNPEILIAGCGTGQHSIATAQLFSGAKILAIDLSLSSLAYAKRKTEEMGIKTITYAQGDLLKLGALGRKFDVIESSGVLHHLENPFEGLQQLIFLLRPLGVMRLGFYSELARRDIARVRELILNEGIGSSAQEIRNYRRKLFNLENSGEFGLATRNSDFFSVSACRDLLFHVQEQCMNLKVLSDFFKANKLNFLGFEIDESVIQSYKNRFANDPAATNLEQWKVYEEENPDTFIGMYQFCVQKKN